MKTKVTKTRPERRASTGSSSSGNKRNKENRTYVNHDYKDHAQDPVYHEMMPWMESTTESTTPAPAPPSTSTSTTMTVLEQQAAEAAAANRRGPRGGVVVPFPERLYDMLRDADPLGFDDVVSWQPHGRCFIIHDPKRFVDDVMPRYFRQSKLTSFQRQVNLYGYVHVLVVSICLLLCLLGIGPLLLTQTHPFPSCLSRFRRLTAGRDKGGYYHELFLRGRSDLFKRMVRIRVKGTGCKAAASPDTEPDFYAFPVCLEAQPPSQQPQQSQQEPLQDCQDNKTTTTSSMSHHANRYQYEQAERRGQEQQGGEGTASPRPVAVSSSSSTASSSASCGSANAADVSFDPKTVTAYHHSHHDQQQKPLTVASIGKLNLNDLVFRATPKAVVTTNHKKIHQDDHATTGMDSPLLNQQDEFTTVGASGTTGSTFAPPPPPYHHQQQPQQQPQSNVDYRFLQKSIEDLTTDPLFEDTFEDAGNNGGNNFVLDGCNHAFGFSAAAPSSSEHEIRPLQPPRALPNCQLFYHHQQTQQPPAPPQHGADVGVHYGSDNASQQQQQRWSQGEPVQLSTSSQMMIMPRSQELSLPSSQQQQQQHHHHESMNNLLFADQLSSYPQQQMYNQDPHYDPFKDQIGALIQDPCLGGVQHVRQHLNQHYQKQQQQQGGADQKMSTEDFSCIFDGLLDPMFA